MEEKINTSIQYQFINIKFFDDIFYDWDKFNEDLNKEPKFMIERLFNDWNKLKDSLKENPNLILKDADKEVKKVTLM